ncbi:MAG TPA: HupE/UreJ family protein [Planctomycetota bacterium]|jgi:hypothetical protein
MFSRRNSYWFAGLIFAGALLCRPVSAHITMQSALELIVFPDRVEIVIHPTLGESHIALSFLPDGDNLCSRKMLLELLPKHAQYILDRLIVKSDGERVTGRVLRIESSSIPESGLTMGELITTSVHYTFEYKLSKPPTMVTFEQDVYKDRYFSGQPYDFIYLAKYRQSVDKVADALPVSHKNTLNIPCVWPEPTPEPNPDEKAQRVEKSNDSVAAPAVKTRANFWSTGGEYALHGLRHIIPSGFDHLLFVSALVLAVSRLWELVKIVTAFTLAHSVTLTLAVLGWVRLPGYIVEPVIAGSIIFVAVENLFWPDRGKGNLRLAVAFAFGLFHGMGFAGGLLDAMAGMPAGSASVAIGSFSLGVETGHQLVVLPLFGIMMLLLRRQYDDIARREQATRLTLRLGSTLIAVGGCYYMIAAIWL